MNAGRGGRSRASSSGGSSAEEPAERGKAGHERDPEPSEGDGGIVLIGAKVPPDRFVEIAESVVDDAHFYRADNIDKFSRCRKLSPWLRARLPVRLLRCRLTRARFKCGATQCAWEFLERRAHRMIHGLFRLSPSAIGKPTTGGRSARANDSLPSAHRDRNRGHARVQRPAISTTLALEKSWCSPLFWTQREDGCEHVHWSSGYWTPTRTGMTKWIFRALRKPFASGYPKP